MRSFWRDRKGNVAVLFAFAIVPVIGGVGAAIDYSMASAYRTDLQQALDSTALALSKVLPVDEATMNKVGNDYFFASLGHHTLTDVQLSIVPSDGKVTLSATGKYTPGIANIFGAQQFTVGATSEAIWSMGKVEIALVLDNSGSMGSQGRMDALKDATKNLIDVLESATKSPEDAKISIVPFDSAVRVNYNCRGNADASCAAVTSAALYGGSSWIRFDWWDNNVGTCSFGSYSNRSACESATSGSCSGATGNNQNQCTNRGGKWVTVNGVWTPTPRNHASNGWYGCVYDRDKSPSLNYDVLDMTPNTNPAQPTHATKYPAKRCDDDGIPRVLPLTNDWTLLKNHVDTMSPSGWTNITIGLVWGWHELSPGHLFTEAVAYGTENYTKYILLMTDGDNTRNRFGDSTSTMDSRTSAVCTNIKNAGIKIYTVRLIDGNATLLRNCASNTSMYYEVQDAGQLSAVFQAIGSQIASLHLAK